MKTTPLNPAGFDPRIPRVPDSDFIVFYLSFALLAPMDHFAHGSRDSRWTPPDQYGLVESQVYRSAFLTPASFDFINLLNLRTVVNLSQEVPVRAVLSFFQENNITLENVRLTANIFKPRWCGWLQVKGNYCTI